MKTKTFILLTLITMTLSSFTIDLRKTSERNTLSPSEQFAIRVITALQYSSPEEYHALIPSLQEFHQLMDKNALLYGDMLPEAKAEFTNAYNGKLLLDVKHSFDEVVAQGKAKGVNWQAVQIVRVDTGTPESGIAAPVMITLSSNQKEYTIRIEKALFLNGEWKSSQFIRFL